MSLLPAGAGRNPAHRPASPGKFAVFRAAIEAGAWPPWSWLALLCSAVAAFFYLRVIVLMYFSPPAADGPTVGVPGLPTIIVLASPRRRRSRWASCPGRCSTWRSRRLSRRLMTGARAEATALPPRSGTGLPTRRRPSGPGCPRARWVRRSPTASPASRRRCTTAVGSEHPFVREAAGHLMAAGRQALPADAGAAGRAAGRPGGAAR